MQSNLLRQVAELRVRSNDGGSHTGTQASNPSTATSQASRDGNATADSNLMPVSSRTLMTGDAQQWL